MYLIVKSRCGKNTLFELFFNTCNKQYFPMSTEKFGQAFLHEHLRGKAKL
jgi:hypothetical protein